MVSEEEKEFYFCALSQAWHEGTWGFGWRRHFAGRANKHESDFTTYPTSWRECAVDIEEADGVPERALLEGRVLGRCRVHDERGAVCTGAVLPR